MRRFQQVDVFGGSPFRGNPVAVVLDADGMTDDEMRDFAVWTNLSETTFVLPPTTPAASYRVRIFSLSRELPFAGHPTLGTAHAWVASGGKPFAHGRLVQECKAGLIPVRVTDDGFAFAAPPTIRSGAVDPALVTELVAQLRIDAKDVLASQWVSNGPGWVALHLTDAAAVLAVTPGQVTHDIGLVGFHPEGAPYRYEVRAFFPNQGATIEDPVTGSLNASLAQWLLASGRVTAPYVAKQGTAMDRDGRITIQTDEAGTVWVGGRTVTCVNGTLRA